MVRADIQVKKEKKGKKEEYVFGMMLSYMLRRQCTPPRIFARHADPGQSGFTQAGRIYRLVLNGSLSSRSLILFLYSLMQR